VAVDSQAVGLGTAGAGRSVENEEDAMMDEHETEDENEDDRHRDLPRTTTTGDEDREEEQEDLGDIERPASNRTDRPYGQS
jgi:hypothetical protein